MCQEEKAVCGVTKHTTCADMVQALLDDHRSLPESRRQLHGEPKEFCLVERWKGFERALPPLTRILRLWNAWGEEKPSIQFVLVKTSECAPPAKAGKRSSRSRSAAVGRARRWEQCPAQYAKTLPVERQKRLVKKAFRKLDRIRRESEPAAATGRQEGSEEIDGMVRLIISQDHTLRQQLQHMRELDLQIEQNERLLRQEGGAGAEGVGAGALSNSPRLSLTDSYDSQWLCEGRLQGNLHTNDSVEQLEEQLRRHQELIFKLSQDIDVELQSGEWLPGDEETLGATAMALPPDLGVDAPELKSTRTELEHSMRAGLSLYSQTQELERELQCHDTTLLSKSQECQLLAAQLSALHLGEGSPQPGPSPLKSQAKCSVEQQGLGADKIRQGLTADAIDTDSDTGISSTHSQDSLSPTVSRRPPLDTDV